MTADPICFVTKCKSETLSLTPTSVKGLKCLGQCKGEQKCASQCFNKYTSPELESWLNCALERESCLPLPPSATSSSIVTSPLPPPEQNLDLNKLSGKWYKVFGKSPIYDLFPCQTNTFTPTSSTTLLADIFLRINSDESGYYESRLTEDLKLDSEGFLNVVGKMYGLTFNEKWSVRVVGEAVLVDYVGETMQGEYRGGFVYKREKEVDKSFTDSISKYVDLSSYSKIDNSCPATVNGRGSIVREKGEVNGGEWKDLIFGEGGIGDWVNPGWRGEYDQK
ncbi:hypothetical protein TrST_g7181 [Triparma strigata]|uniref:VDE lipocalin domain-containing protein n=1 Tax=Triparma strigata TaxID=1606541 RepID=A0A9W7AJX9_9STRA|nr:hypothetical protein TrST_g7181 [Triparma strigata]